ncbi:cofactor assembly of complex C subunit B [Leptolyngbya sp. AN02str]|uniref:cofactor assembly of complex C subunit B n=1 Tax=Leptolyngbya sp. AN02str TaxID=3423363 RepID=UPI003D31365A
MHLPVLSSTVFLTLLLGIGLFFFIRASVKDRTEVAKFVAEQPQVSLLEDLQRYFMERAYRIAAVDAEKNQVRFEGMVRPSGFLAVFLSGLAAVGILCLSLVLSMANPRYATVFPFLTLLAPLAGIFYWKKAGRQESVTLQVEALESDSETPRNLVLVKAHRDEVIELQRSLKLAAMDE